MKTKYPHCWSVAFHEARYFLYHKFKVVDDRDFIRSLIKANDFDMLDYMENFYILLRQDQTCNKDISSRNYLKPLTNKTFNNIVRKNVHLLEE